MKYIKKLFRYLFIFLLSFISFVLLYFLCAYLFTILPSNSNSIQPKDGIEVFIASNGVHTDVVVPVSIENVDWTGFIPVTDFRAEDKPFSHIAFGWGDKGFYLNTPTWSELKFSTAFNAMFCGGATAMHVTYKTAEPVTGDRCKRIIISKAQYKQLTDYIRSSFLLDKSGNCVLIDCCRYEGRNDSFYEGLGTYYFFRTCNVWTNNALKNIGVKTAFWAPFSSSVLYHL